MIGRRSRRLLLGVLAVVTFAVGCDTDSDPADPADPGGADEAGDALGEEPDTAFGGGFLADDDCFGFAVSGLEPDEVECGVVEVPLRHEDPDAGTIELATAVLPGTDAGEHDHPLLLLGGGPGEALVENLLTMPELRAIYDVGPQLIALDQRGAGASRPALDCPALPDAESPETAPQDAAADLEVVLEALGDCRDRLVDEGVDLDAFDHVENARDIELVRNALGHDQFDVRGGSYGTQLALLAAADDPDGIRSLILSSPVDPTENWVEGSAAGLAQALAAVVEGCAADEACSADVGDLDAALIETTDRLAAEPEEVTVTPPGGEEVTTTYTPEVFLSGVTNLFYLGDGVALVPALIDRARDGDLQPLATIVAIIAQQVQDTVSTGMQLSMLCSGEAGLFDPGSALEELDGGLIEEYWFPISVVGGAPTPDMCEVWDVEQSYEPDQIELATQVPTLIVTGAFDHVTPPQLGEQIDDMLATSHLVEVPVVGHGPLEALGPCGQQIVGDFLDAPETRPADDCATEIPMAWQTELPAGLG